MKNTIKQKRIINEDMSMIRNLFIILVVVVIVCFGLFKLTDKMTEKELNNSSNNKVTIDYDSATIGTMFNRIEDEYQVIIYSKEDNGKDLDSLLDTYRSSDNYIKTYYVNLDLKFNEIAKSDNLVRNPKNSSEVKVNVPTMYKLKNGVVTNCYSGIDDIKKILEG